MATSNLNNTVLLLPGGIIMAWGLQDDNIDSLPIPGELHEEGLPFDCPYHYQFPEHRCPVLGHSDLHDEPASMKCLTFGAGIGIDTHITPEKKQIFIKITPGSGQAFWLKVNLGEGHRHVQLKQFNGTPPGLGE